MTAATDLWLDWFDTEVTSIGEALAVFRIVTDVDEEQEEADNFVPEVPFVLRPRQADALDRIETYFWKLKKRAARLIVLKSRRYGMTTFFLLLGLERILRVPGFAGLLIAQDDKMAEYHFQRMREWLRQIPEKALDAQGIEIVQDTKHQIILRHKGGKTSSFTVAPAKRNALGRGAQFNAIFVTEFPAWPKSAKRDLSGVLRSCRNVRGNIIVFESTAHGYEEFHRRYKRAEKRQSDYWPMFIASYEHPGNRKKFETPEQERDFVKSIGTVKEYGDIDETVLFRRLTIELSWSTTEAAQFLNWRRSTLIDDCEGSLDHLHREEPNTADEAFAGTGLPLFKKEIIEAWRPAAELREESAERLRVMLSGDKIRFFEDRQSELVVFERPIPGEVYAFGTDVASGIAVYTDGKTEADFGYTTVKLARTGVTVARLRGHIEPSELARMTFALACWYNGARGYIERAINDSGVCINTFETLEWKAYRGDFLLLSQLVLIKTDKTNANANRNWTPGFKTNRSTKPKLVDNIRAKIKAVGLPDENKECPFDLQFISEAMVFERDDRTGKMEASTGHDDAVISEGLCLEAIERLYEQGDMDAAPKPQEGPKSGDDILIDYCKHMSAHREEETNGPGVSGMPDY